MVRLRFVLKVFVVGFAALVIGSHAVAAQEPARRVLMLYPYDNARPFSEIAGAAIRRRMVEKSGSNIEIDISFLDLSRFPADADERRSARYLAEKYSGKPLDLIIPLGTEAERFAV